MKYNSSTSDNILRKKVFVQITGISSALNLLRDKIWTIFDQKEWRLYSQKSDIFLSWNLWLNLLS